MSGLWTILVGNALPAFVLAGLAYLISRTFRRPALTHLLWVLVLVKLVTPPWLPWSISVSPETAAVIGITSTDRSTVSPTTVNSPRSPRLDGHAVVSRDDAASSGPAEVATPPTHAADSSLATNALLERASNPSVVTRAFRWLHGEWFSVVGIVWITGTLISVYIVLRILSCLRYRFSAAEPIDAASERHVRRLASTLGLQRAPQVRLVEGIVSPLIWGVGPFTTIIFPRTLWDTLPSSPRDALLLHELAHYRRGDQWVRVLEIVVSCLYWWHPCVWWARRELATAEEECCDAWVVRRAGHQPRSYAEAIITTLDYLAGEPDPGRVFTTGVNTMPVLKRRLRNIMHRTVSPVLPQPALWGLLAAAAVTLPLQPFVQIVPGSRTAAALNAERVLNDAASRSNRDAPSISAAVDGEDVLVEANQRSGQPRGFWSPQLESQSLSFINSPDRRFTIELQRGYQAVAVIDNESQTRHDLSEENITCLVFTPDGNRFVTGSATGEVRVWEASTGNAVSLLGPMEDDRVTSIDISSNGSWVVTGSDAGSVMVWELASGAPKATWATDSSRINCIRVLDDDRIVVSTGHFLDPLPGQIVMLNAQTLEPIFELSTERLIATIEPDGQTDERLLLTDYSGTVWSWDGAETMLTFRNEVPKSDVERAAFSPAYRVTTPL